MSKAARSEFTNSHDNIKYKHSHAINIIEHTSTYLVLLVFPIIRALFIGNIGFYAWLRGAWFDIIVIITIIALGFWAWYKYIYMLADDGIFIKQGVILPKYRYIPYSKLSVVSIEHPFFLIPFRAVHISADTNGGHNFTPDFQITIHKSQVENFINRANRPFVNHSEIKRVYLPKNFYIAVLSFVASNTLTGVIFAATFISGVGKVLGSEFENQMMIQITAIAKFMAFGLPPMAAWLAFIILGGWALSFLLNLIRHMRFCVTRQGGCLYIKRGIFTKREYYITSKRINLIELRQTLVTKIFGFYTALVHANGYGKGKDELSVFMPSGESFDLMQNMKLLLPEIPICKPVIRPRKKYLSRFMIPPLTSVLIVSALWLISYYIFLDFRDIVVFIGLMAEIPCFWYLGVKIISYFHTGVGQSESAYTFCYTYGYRIKTVAVPKKRIVKLTIRRSLFQVMSGCCDLVVLTFSEGKKRHVIPNINFEQAKVFMDAQGFYH